MNQSPGGNFRSPLSQGSIKILISLLVFTRILSQTVYEEILYENGEELDTFAYQLPENFDSELTYP